MLVEALRRAPPLYHGQPLALLLGLFLMVLGNASHVSGIDASLRFDPTPFLFIPAGGAVAWGLFRFGLFDVVPVARNRVVEGMDDGVIVVDTHGRVVDLNLAAQRTLGYLASQAAGREAARAFGGWPDLVALCHDETATQAESVWGAGDAQRHYDLRCVLMTDRRGVISPSANGRRPNSSSSSGRWPCWRSGRGWPRSCTTAWARCWAT